MFTILDVRSIFTLSSTLDEYLEVRIQARDRQYSFCTLILETSHKDPEKIDLECTTSCTNTCRTHGRDMTTRYIGSTSILRFGKD